jgi:hypothetical protein
MRQKLIYTLLVTSNTNTQHLITCDQARINHTLLRNAAPAHKTGARCLEALNPNKLANQSIVVTAMGASSSSVWCRNGSAL